MKKTVLLLVAIFLGLTATDALARAIVKADGSSTVYPITEAVAEEFRDENTARIRTTIGVSGTGGGFKKFCTGETDIQNASRPIKKSEVAACAKNGVEYVELPVAYDGLAVVVNLSNDWVDHFTVEELKKIWEPAAQGKLTRWSQVREGWPDKEIRLFGPGVDSGTFDYFTEAIVGESGASRGDFTASEDDNVLVQGISTDRLAMGFFGFAYYDYNRDSLKLVPIEDGNDSNGSGPILAEYDNILNGTYQPLSRPLFIYVAKESLKRPEVKQFAGYYLSKAAELSREVGYVSLPERAYELGAIRMSKGVHGSVFGGEGSQVGVKVEELLEKGF